GDAEEGCGAEVAQTAETAEAGGVEHEGLLDEQGGLEKQAAGDGDETLPAGGLRVVGEVLTQGVGGAVGQVCPLPAGEVEFQGGGAAGGAGAVGVAGVAGAPRAPGAPGPGEHRLLREVEVQVDVGQG